MNNKPNNNPLIAFHARMMDEYYRNWFSGGDAGEEDRKKDAYHLLEHAGILARLTGDGEILRLLEREPPEERRALVIAAFTAEDASEGHEKAVAQAGDDVETLEQAIIHRDTMDGVWTAGMEISWDFDRDEDAEMAEATDGFFVRAANLDHALTGADRRALCSAMHVMDAVRELAPDEDLWWLDEPGPMLAAWHRANRKPLIDVIMSDIAETEEEAAALSGEAHPGKVPVPAPLQGVSPAPVSAFSTAFAASSSFLLPMAADSPGTFKASFQKPGLPHMSFLTATPTAGREVWEFRLDEEGKFPDWAEGAGLALKAAGEEICASPFDKYGIAEIPSEAVQAHIGDDGVLVIIAENGAPLSVEIPLSSFKAD